MSASAAWDWLGKIYNIEIGRSNDLKTDRMVLSPHQFMEFRYLCSSFIHVIHLPLDACSDLGTNLTAESRLLGTSRGFEPIGARSAAAGAMYNRSVHQFIVFWEKMRWIVRYWGCLTGSLFHQHLRTWKDPLWCRIGFPWQTSRGVWCSRKKMHTLFST